MTLTTSPLQAPASEDVPTAVKRRNPVRFAILIALAILLLLTLAPFLVVALNAVKTPSDYAEHAPIVLPRALDLTGIVELLGPPRVSTKIGPKIFSAAIVVVTSTT